jgi:hypothetical protein
MNMRIPHPIHLTALALGLGCLLVWSAAMSAAARASDAAALEGPEDHDAQVDHPASRGPDAASPWRRDGRAWTDRIGPEQIDAALDVLDEVDPDLAERVRRYREQEPEAVMTRLRPHLPTLMRLNYLKRSDPEHYALRVADARLERRTLDLSRQYQEAAQRGEDAAGAELRQHLREAVAEHFQVRQQLREKMLADLRQRVERLEQQIQQRQEARESLIDKRLAELTEQTAGPRW